jgi:hypothetical protein
MNESRIVQSLEQAAAQTDMQRSLLRLTSVLQQSELSLPTVKPYSTHAS